MALGFTQNKPLAALKLLYLLVQMKTPLSVVALLFLLITGWGNVSAATVTFTELPPQPADGVSLLGVTFDYKIGGIDSLLDATFGGSGPGITTFTVDPGLEGNTAGTLSLGFGTAVTSLQFGVALSTNVTLANGFTVSLFDPGAVLLSTSPIGVTPGSFAFSSGQFNYLGGPVSRADITFNPVAGRFSLDNLSFDSPSPGVPEGGSTFAILGIALFCLGAVKWSLSRRPIAAALSKPS